MVLKLNSVEPGLVLGLVSISKDHYKKANVSL